MRFVRLLALMALMTPSISRAQIKLDRDGEPLPAGAVTRLGSAAFRHAGRDFGAVASAFSPDGRFLATVSHDTAIIWDARSCRRCGTITAANDARIRHAVFLPDSKSIALAIGDSIRVVPITKEYFSVRADLPKASDDQTIVWLQPLPGGRGFVFVEKRRNLGLADESGKIVRSVPHGAVQPLAALSNDAKTLTIWNQDWVERWDVEKLTKLGSVKFPYLGQFHRLRLRPDGALMAIHLDEGMLLYWDPVTGKDVSRLKDSSLTMNIGMEFTPGGKQVATVTPTAGADAIVQLWDVATNKLERKFTVPLSEMGNPVVSHDGRLVTFNAARPAVSLWDVTNAKTLFERRGIDEVPTSLTFASDGRLIAGGGRQLCVWDAASGNLQTTVRLPLECGAVALSPSGSWAAVLGNNSDGPRLCDLTKGTVSAPFAVPAGTRIQPGMLGVSHDGHSVLALGWTGDFNAPCRIVWNASTFQVTGVTRYEGEGKKQFFAPPYRAQFVSEDSDFDTPTRRAEFHALDDDRLLLRVRPAGTPQLLVSGGLIAGLASPAEPVLDEQKKKGERFEFWEIISGASLPSFQSEYTLAAMTPDGRTAVLARNSTLAIRDIGGEGELQKLDAGGPIRSLAVSADGRRLATGHDDGTVLIWDVSRITRRGSDPRTLGPGEAEAAWHDLGLGVEIAFKAAGTLMADPAKAVAMCRERLKPVAPLQANRVKQLILELDSPGYSVREGASRKLAALGERTVTELQAARNAGPSPEAKRRLEKLLADPFLVRSEDGLRWHRAVLLLERIGTPEAKAVLKSLASGDPSARETRAARRALGP